MDADACPKEIRRIVFKAAERLCVEVVVVANTRIQGPQGDLFSYVIVPGGMDKADAHIAAEAEDGDIVITADVPLAARAVAQGAVAINPRGTLYDEATIGERLATRNLLSRLRTEGEVKGGPAPFRETDKRRFANALDRLLAQRPLP